MILYNQARVTIFLTWRKWSLVNYKSIALVGYKIFLPVLSNPFSHDFNSMLRIAKRS